MSIVVLMHNSERRVQHDVNRRARKAVSGAPSRPKRSPFPAAARLMDSESTPGIMSVTRPPSPGFRRNWPWNVGRRTTASGATHGNGVRAEAASR